MTSERNGAIQPSYVLTAPFSLSLRLLVAPLNVSLQLGTLDPPLPTPAELDGPDLTATEHGDDLHLAGGEFLLPAGP